MAVTIKKVWKVVKWILFILGLLLGGWVLAFLGVNVGKWISRLTGRSRNTVKPILNREGENIGSSVPIEPDKNPFRDKSILKLINGEEIQLPDGVEDSDVVRIYKSEVKGYNVEVTHEKMLSTDFYAALNKQSDDSE